MKLTKNLLQKPLTIVTLFVLLTLAGAVLTSRLALDLFPEVDVPVMAVVTPYPMATPLEVEQNVTRQVEEQLLNVGGLDKITSLSMENMSQVILWFDYGTDLQDAKADIRDKLELLGGQLPEDSDTPMIYSFDPNAEAIMELSLQGDQDLMDLYAMAEDQVKPRLERLAGVAEVEISGGLEERVEVNFYQERLEALGLTVAQVSQALASQNSPLSAGEIQDGQTSFILQTMGELEDLDQLSMTVIAQRPLSQTSTYEVLLRDVADVERGTQDRENSVLINGQEGILLSIKKIDQANMVDVVDQVSHALPEINRSLPGDMELSLLSDNSQQVRSTLNQVMSSAYWGIFFAVLILLLFLRQFRSTLIIAISIPVSLMITIGAMSLAGKTFNTLTLTGLVLALGMIVDGSIVILENIFRYRERGVSLDSATEIGTQEMIGPITGSILTSVSVFLPLLIFKKDLGMIGIMFEDMAFTVIVALLSSLLVALLLVPVLAKSVFPLHTRKEKPLKSKFLKGLDSILGKSMDGLTLAYKKTLNWCLNHRKTMVTLSLVLLVSAAAVIPRLGMIMMPPSGESSIIMTVELPQGTPLEQTEDLMLQWQEIARQEVPQRNSLIVRSGQGSSNLGELLIGLPPADQRDQTDQEIKDRLRLYYPMFPDAQFSFSTTDQARAMSGGSDLTLQIQSSNMDDLNQSAAALEELISNQIPQVVELRNSQSDSLPQLELQLDRQRIYDLGLNIQTIAYELRARISGVTGTTISLDDETYDVHLQLREEDRNESLDINQIFVLNPRTGQAIPFASFGEIVESQGPVTIQREDRIRTLELAMDLQEGAKPNLVQKEIEELISQELALPDGVAIVPAGQMEMLTDTMDSIWIVLLFAALLVFAVMVSQFESLKSPFIIFLMIPMLLIGVSAVYLITGHSLSMPSMIGIVMLLGIVVNNGIILVDAINLFRKRGMTVFTAALEASAQRLRPVLMTTLTTVLAMVPMAFFPGRGGEMVQPMGLTIIGGLVSNSLITLFLVPVLYISLHKRQHKRELTNTTQEAISA